MKRFVIFMMALLISMTIAKADGFNDQQTEYFFGRTYTITYTDDVPPQSDHYFMAYTIDNGMNWTRFTDTLDWSASTTATATLNIMQTGMAQIGIFTDPDGNWVSVPESFNTEFNYSDDYEFIVYPDTIFNGGTYQFAVRVNPNEAPPELTLRYSLDNGNSWLRWETYVIDPNKNTLTFSIDNGNITNDVIFQLYYENPTHVVCGSPLIPFKERETYFRFKTTGGQKEINDQINLMWEKSYNFKSVLIVTYLDNEVIQGEKYFTDGIEVNFPKNGNYTIVGVVEDDNFNITNSILFTVGDPCSLIKAQNVILNDSIVKLNEKLKMALETIDILTGIVEDMKIVALRQDSVINSLQEDLFKVSDELVKLNVRFIRYKLDSTIVQLVYKDRDVVTVKDFQYVKDVKTIEYNDNVVKFLEPFVGETTIWIFGISGKLEQSIKFNTPTVEMNVDYLSVGVYYVWILNDNIYTLYKFIKI